MFIGSHVDSLTEQERYFNPIYLIVQQGKEYLKQQLIRGSVCDCDTTIPNRTIGVFSVSQDRQVTFSQGNLQYFPAANLWKFANTQYESLGNSNKYISPTYRNWVDLFAFSTDYTEEFLDWGTKWICGDKPGTWRTLSADEWEYLLKKRPNATYLHGIAQVADKNGKLHIHCKAGADRTGMYAFIYKALNKIGSLAENEREWIERGHNTKLYPNLRAWTKNFIKTLK